MFGEHISINLYFSRGWCFQIVTFLGRGFHILSKILFFVDGFQNFRKVQDEWSKSTFLQLLFKFEIEINQVATKSEYHLC